MCERVHGSPIVVYPGFSCYISLCRIQQRQQVRVIPMLNVAAVVGGKRVRFWLYGSELNAYPAKLPTMWDRLSHRVTTSVTGLLRGAFKFATGSTNNSDDES